MLINVIISTDFDDVLLADSSVTELRGGPGNDVLAAPSDNGVIVPILTLIGGTGGDLLIGGQFATTEVDYSGSTAGIVVDLLEGRFEGGDAQGDEFVNIERLIGSSFGDFIRGELNTITGNGGNDVMLACPPHAPAVFSRVPIGSRILTFDETAWA